MRFRLKKEGGVFPTITYYRVMLKCSFYMDPKENMFKCVNFSNTDILN